MKPGDILEVEPGVFSVLLDGASFEARISGTTMSVDGHRFPLTADSRKASEDSFNGQIVASMPAKVVRLLVEPGQTVDADQGILVLEAMKMQNEIRTPVAGRVTALHVKVHDSVVAGTTLAAIEQAG